jgi:hypothetical protein
MVKTTKLSLDPVTVAQLCVEYWKLAATTEKALNILAEKESKRLEAQLKFSKRQLDVLLQNLDLRLVDFAGEHFHPGLAVSVDNPSDYDEENLIISKTIEPAVMSDMTIIRLGRVIVAPFEQNEE